MKALQPRFQLLVWLVLAGVGLALFFSGEFRDIPFPVGWIGTFLFVASVWFSVDALYRVPHSDAEAQISHGEWQAWVGVAFVGAVIAASLMNAQVFMPHVSIRENPEAGAVGQRIGTLFIAWLVLAEVLKQRWAGKIITDERDAQIERDASQWGRYATMFVVIGIALLLGFSDTARLQQFSYPFIAQLLMTAVLVGVWFDQLIAAILYWRDRRATAE